MVGIYATVRGTLSQRTLSALLDLEPRCWQGHSYFGQPSPRYIARLLPTVMSQPAVAGVSVYTLKGPATQCGELDGIHGGDMACIIRDAYTAADGYLGTWPSCKTDDRFAFNDDHPVRRHVGTWTENPKRCPSSMVTDAPLLGNGELGAVFCGAEANADGGIAQSTRLGQMDFWTEHAIASPPGWSHVRAHGASGFTHCLRPTHAVVRR